MNVSSASAPVTAPLINVLKSTQQAQVDMVEKLITTGLEVRVQAEEMAIAEHIIDVYA